MNYQLSEQEIQAHRPKPFFFLTTDDPAEYGYENVRESLVRMKACGFGGFILFNKPPTGFTKETYLSDFWFEVVRTFALCARELDLAMWINDGFDYPPGSVAGRVKDLDPTLHQQRICLKDGELAVEKVEWGYPAFENPRSSELFHDLVHEQYLSHVGDLFGDPIRGFFSDADNRRVIPAVMFDEHHPCRDYFPWANDFETQFREKFGYDIRPHMKDVMARKDIPEAADYWTMAGDLYRGWFRRNAEWLHAHHLLYTGHSSDSAPFLYKDAPRSSCLTESRFSSIQNVFDYPGTDQELWALDGGKHMKRSTWYTPHAVFGEPLRTEKMTDPSDTSHDTRAKQVGSTAFLYGKKGGMCEMFAATNFDVSPAELMRIAAFQILQGITFVVEHAYHYRFFGSTKYFAPPEFSERGCLGYAVKPLNDEIAALCAMMEKGQNVCPVALLDPTEAVWRNHFDSERYFQAFAALNRKPWGFVIADIDKVLNGNYGFKAAVLAGFDLDGETKQKLKARGIALVDETTLDSLQTVIGCDVIYSGEGTPFFARRIIDHEEFTFIAGIEDDQPIHGTLRGYGREKKLTLYPGDVRYFSAHYDNLEDDPLPAPEVGRMPDEVAVTFEKDNILPLEIFANPEQKTVTKSDPDAAITCCFDATAELHGIRLFIPAEDDRVIRSVELDGRSLSAARTEKVYDDICHVYELGTLNPGRHGITIRKEGSIPATDRIFLSGSFDVDIQTDGTEYRSCLSFYNMEIYIPERAVMTLSPRRQTLRTDRSWAEQGQPFYSGEVTYRFPFDAKEAGTYRLELPRVRDVVDLRINGTEPHPRRRIKYPYTFTFDLGEGHTELCLDVVNSLGNAFEYFREESGILSGAVIRRIRN